MLVMSFFPLKKLRRNAKCLFAAVLTVFVILAAYLELTTDTTWDDNIQYSAEKLVDVPDSHDPGRQALHDNREEQEDESWRSSYRPQPWKPEYKGQANLHIFEDWCGSSTSQLRKNLHYPLYPHSRLTVKKLAVSPRWTNYGLRIFGYLHPDVDGQYQFAVASDDNSEFWLSLDDSPLNLRLLAFVGKMGTEWTAPGEYGKYASQLSSAIQLTAERRYYFEVIHKQDTKGTDHVEVAWKLSKAGDRFRIIDHKHISLYSYEISLKLSEVGHIPQSAASHTRSRSTLGALQHGAEMLREDLRDTFYQVPLITDHYLKGVLPACSYNPSYIIKGFPLLRYQGLQFVHLSSVYPNDYTRLTHMETDNKCFYRQSPWYLERFGFSKYMKMDVPENREQRYWQKDGYPAGVGGVAEEEEFQYEDPQLDGLQHRQHVFMNPPSNGRVNGFFQKRRTLSISEVKRPPLLERRRRRRVKSQSPQAQPTVDRQQDAGQLARTPENRAPSKVLWETGSQRQLKTTSPVQNVPDATLVQREIPERDVMAANDRRQDVQNHAGLLKAKDVGFEKPLADIQNLSLHDNATLALLLAGSQTPRLVSQAFPVPHAKRFESRRNSAVPQPKRKVVTRNSNWAQHRNEGLLEDTVKRRPRGNEGKMYRGDGWGFRPMTTVGTPTVEAQNNAPWDADGEADRYEEGESYEMINPAIFDPEVNWAQTFDLSPMDLQAMRSDWIDLKCNVSGNLLLRPMDALAVVKAFMVKLTQKYPGVFSLARVVNVEKRADHVRGARYLLELELKMKDGVHVRLSHYVYVLRSAAHSSYRVRALGDPDPPEAVLCQPLGLSWRPSATVHLIVPVKNQARWVQQFIVDMENLHKVTGDKNFNVIIVDYSSTDMDVELALHTSSLPSHQYVRLRGNFERSAGLQAGIDGITDEHSIVFLCDLHIHFPNSIIDNIRKHCIEGKMAFAPIVMRLNCGASPQEPNGFWEVNGFGLLGIYKSDLNMVGGMNTKDFRDRWGGEDWELLDRILQAGLEVERIYVRNFMHHYHSKRGMWNRQSFKST